MRIIALVFFLSGCNLPQRPEVVQRVGGDDVVSLPGGGALLLQRAREREPDVCWVRARSFRGFISMPCDLAEAARP